ncbi:MAG TPA: FtsW/RodA/SpoVE family cell cycle protein [Solirubrobacteraceae bacterium]|nr:FtsW/RodA/SpoVE family cell cycle protein [Solirubrobacteraceae bacterium]
MVGGAIQAPQQGRESDPLAPRLPRIGLDPLLLLAAIGLGVISLVTLGGISHAQMVRQGVYLGVGLVIMLAISRFDYSRLRELKWGLYVILVGAILVVLALGRSIGGISTRSIAVGGFSFQGSEVAKVVLIVFLAAFVVDSSRKTSSRQLVSRVILLTLGPTMLVIAEPDLGSALVFVSAAFAILYIAGADWRHLTAVFALGVVALAVVLVAGPLVGFHTYQADRLTAFLDPGAVPAKQIASALYQQHESVIAIGAGQKFGLGHVAPTTAANFVPLNSTDFIFAALAERFGFAGAALVLSLYALMIWRTLRIVAASKNLFGALIAAGIVAMLVFQVFVNVGVTEDILPVTGVTLPLLSYGGSSVLTTFLALGLLQSIHAQARIIAATKGRVLSI